MNFLKDLLTIPLTRQYPISQKATVMPLPITPLADRQDWQFYSASYKRECIYIIYMIYIYICWCLQHVNCHHIEFCRFSSGLQDINISLKLWSTHALSRWRVIPAKLQRYFVIYFRYGRYFSIVQVPLQNIYFANYPT